MSFDGSIVCWVPDIPITVDKEWRLQNAQFGDGYSQRTLDGINALNLRWGVTFDYRPNDVVLEMDAYLQAVGAKSFPFRDPGSGFLYRVFCDNWSIEWSPRRRVNGVSIYYGSLSAEFVKANGVGV